MLSVLSIRPEIWLRCVLCLMAAAQLAAQPYDRARDAWRWTQFTADDGLPSSQLARIVETESGVSWAVTSKGLAWFDGYSWQVVAGLPRVRPKSVDLRGERLFVVVAGLVYQGGQAGFSRLDFKFDGLMDVFKVIACHDGGLIIEAECRDGVHLLRHANGVTTLAPPCHGSFSRRFNNLRGAGGEAFVCHDGGVDRWMDGEWRQVVHASSQPQITACTAGSAAGAFLLRAPIDVRGLWAWQGSGDPLRSEVPTPAKLLSVTVREAEIVCLDAVGVVFSRREGEWQRLTSAPIEAGAVRSICSRRNGDLWFSSELGAHLYLRSSKRWEFTWESEDRGLNSVHEIQHVADGTVWLATSSGLIHEVDGRRQVYRELCGRRLVNLTGLAVDAAGDLWVSSGSGLTGVLRFDGSEWRHYGSEDGLLAENVHKIRADRGGKLWFLGIGAREVPKDGPGVFMFDGTSFERVVMPGTLPSDRVYDFTEGPDGSRWFATYGGVARWAVDGSFHTWLRPENELGEMAFAIAADKDGLWFGGRGGGLRRIEGDSIRCVDLAEGLSSRRVWNVEIDPEGGVWVATEAGLNYLRDGRVRTVGSALGLRRVWPLELHNGRLYIGMIGYGLVSFELAAITAEAPRITVDPVSKTRSPVLRWRAFAPGGIESPLTLQTRSRVNRGPWSVWGHLRSRALESAAPGSYKLEVEARSLLGAGAVARHTEIVNVAAPLIDQPAVRWAFAALFLLIVLLVGSLWTRRQRHRLELRVQTEGYRDLFENANELIYTLDLDGHITSMNHCAEQELGASRSVLIGTPFADLVASDQRERVEALRLDALNGVESGLHEFEIVRLDDQRIWLEISNRSVSAKAVVVGTQNFARDITARRQLELQLLHAQKMEAVGRLAGGIAHDFNNLLVVIKGFSEMLLTDLPEDSPSRKSLEQIRNAGQRAALLTRQLLAFSRKEVAKPEVLDMSQSLSDMEDLIRRLVGADVELKVEIDPGELCVFADPSQMEQVVMNLIVNSRDAMPDGGLLSIELREHLQRRVADRPVAQTFLKRLPEGDYICLSVTDTGGGMSDEVLARVFEPFFTTKEQGKGTGLGLSTVYGIVQQSGGQIDVQSNAGEGTRFSIYLPMSAELPASSASSVVDDARARGSETVLLVEDELPVRKFIKRSLEQRGYKLLEAEDGREAMDIARAYDGPIHFLLTDVVMPRMGGAELARHIAVERPATKFLFLSGYPGNALAKYDLGDELYLQKPFAIGDLTRKLRELADREPRGCHRDSAL